MSQVEQIAAAACKGRPLQSTGSHLYRKLLEKVERVGHQPVHGNAFITKSFPAQIIGVHARHIDVIQRMGMNLVNLPEITTKFTRFDLQSEGQGQGGQVSFLQFGFKFAVAGSAGIRSFKRVFTFIAEPDVEIRFTVGIHIGLKRKLCFVQSAIYRFDHCMVFGALGQKRTDHTDLGIDDRTTLGRCRANPGG